MTELVEALAAKLDDLSSIPGIHMVEENDQPPQIFF